MCLLADPHALAPLGFSAGGLPFAQGKGFCFEFGIKSLFFAPNAIVSLNEAPQTFSMHRSLYAPLSRGEFVAGYPCI